MRRKKKKRQKCIQYDSLNTYLHIYFPVKQQIYLNRSANTYTEYNVYQNFQNEQIDVYKKKEQKC